MKKEESALGVEGVLLWDALNNLPLFRKYNNDGSFTDYHLTHPDLSVRITDKDAAFYEINGSRYLDISSEGMKPNE